MVRVNIFNIFASFVLNKYLVPEKQNMIFYNYYVENIAICIGVNQY